MQETHIAKKHKRILSNKKLGKEFVASDQSKKRGVVLYVKDKYDPKLVYKDDVGRVLMVQIVFQGEN